LRVTGSTTREELLTDLGLGKRVASIVAKRLVRLLVRLIFLNFDQGRLNA
jgi:GTP pyrophosphokinase